MKTILFASMFALPCAAASCGAAAPAPDTPAPAITPASSTPLTPTATPLPPTTTQPPAIGTLPIPSSVEVVWNINGEPNRFNNPTSLAIDQAGNLYVLYSGNNRIQVFDGDGSFVMMWGTQGAGDGEFNFHRGAGDHIGGIALDAQGNVYVADFGNYRVQKFDSSGNFLLKWGRKGGGTNQFDGPCDVAVDVQGNVHVSNLVPHEETPPRIQKFDSDGNFLARWGSLGAGDGQFTSPCGIVLDSEGNVYVADADNNNVQKFRQK